MFPYSKERLEAARAEVSRYIRDVDDEDDALRIGKVRVADNDQDLGKTRKSGILWKDRPNLFCPTPLIDRPRTKDNHCSFHFSQVPVSKPSVPTVHGKPAPHLYKASYSTAVAHQKYIERDGAAEYSRAARQAAYIERDGAVEEALQSEPSEAVDERPEDVERVPLGPTMQGTELVPSVFSNISENQIEREEYWRAVERRARSPKTHYLALDPYASPRWWDNLDTVIILPPKLLRHLVEMREAKGAHDRGPQGRDGERYRAKDFPVSSDEAGAVLTSVLKSRYVDPANRPARFKPGRSGRIQYRLIAELPFELTPEERAQIVYEFTEFLGKKGLMYTAVIHAPNANNDTRNYHLHVIYHDRPAIFLEDRGCWDFEVSETYKDSSGKKRVRYPLKQPKVLAVAQSSSKSGDQDSGREFIPHLRKEYARITNLVLKAAGHLKRYDPRRYEEMGIKRTPTEHLGSRDAARESIGVPTRRGTRNAKIVWRDAEQAIDEQFEQTMKEHARRQEGYQKVLTAALASGVSDPSVDHLKSLLSGRAETIASIVSSRFGLMRFELLEAKAKSRAVKTRQTCEQMIKSVQEGAADKTTTTNLPLLIQRQELAKDHLENIDADLETFRTHLAVLAEAVCRYEENFLEVDELALRMVKRIQALSPTRMQSLAPVNGSGVGESNDPQATGAKQPVVPITIGGAPIVTPTIAPRIKPVPVTLEAVEEDQVPFAETIRAVRAGGGHVNTGTPANDRLEPPARSLSTPDIIGEPHAQGPDQAPPYVNHQISGRTQEINDAEHRRRRRYSVACSELIEGYNQQHAEAHPRRSSAGGLSSMRKLPRRNLVRDGSHPALPLPSSPLRNVESQ